jgi:CheY-like chemotaxis protein
LRQQELSVTDTFNPAAAPQRFALLVEDEALVAMVAEESLRIIGFEPLSVRTAGEALKILGEAVVPSLAVIDVGLPDIRGDELATRARALAPNMPIIVASGYDEGELNRQFAGDPATAVLSKPYTDRDLARAVVALGLEVVEED